MGRAYWVTGAAGAVGGAVIQMLAERGAPVRALVSPAEAALPLPVGVEQWVGELRDRETLKSFLDWSAEERVVIHAAACGAPGGQPDTVAYDNNAAGTRHLVDLCERYGVERLLYIGSVRSLDRTGAPAPSGDWFAESMAEGALAVLEATGRGLAASLLYLGDIVGISSGEPSPMTRTIVDYCRGELHAAVRGEYAIVDAADAARLALACCETAGERTILAGHRTEAVALFEMLRLLTARTDVPPLRSPGWSRWTAWLSKAIQRLRLEQPRPAIACPTLSGRIPNGWDAPSDFQLRPLRDTLAETVGWLRETGQI